MRYDHFCIRFANVFLYLICKPEVQRSGVDFIKKEYLVQIELADGSHVNRIRLSQFIIYIEPLT